jgi:uncharacterized damage-inducible protein DinB
MNPYAKQLGDRDAKSVVADTPKQLTALVERLGPDGLKRSLGPGKWTMSEVLCHLADCEIAFAFRLRQALAEANHLVQPFNQDIWAQPYKSLDGQAALKTFSALREWNVALLETVPADAFSKRVTHPERGEMTFQTLVDTMAGHDLNHLQQLDALASSHDRVQA